jgi:hypothetical protein
VLHWVQLVVQILLIDVANHSSLSSHTFTYIHACMHTYIHILHSMDPKLVKNDCKMLNKSQKHKIDMHSITEEFT